MLDYPAASLITLQQDIQLSYEALGTYVEYELETEFDDYDSEYSAYLRSHSYDLHSIVLSDLSAMLKFGLIDDKTYFKFLDEYITDREHLYAKFLTQEEKK